MRTLGTCSSALLLVLLTGLQQAVADAVAGTAAQAVLAPDPTALHLYAGICAGTAQAQPAALTHTRAVLIDGDGSLPAMHSALPAEIRADSAATTGLVLCRTPTTTTLETCYFGGLLELPRIRRGYRITGYSVEAPALPRVQVDIAGTAPRACNEAGVLTGATAISGDWPTSADLLAALDAQHIDALDTDGDGYSNLRELVLGTEHTNPATAAPELALSLNHASTLTIAAGKTVSVYLSLHPGALRGALVDYHLYAESPAGVYSYVHPGSVRNGRERAARAPALALDDYEVLRLQGLQPGDYRLHFEIVMPDGALLAAQAQLTVVAAGWSFTDVTQAAGFNYTHIYDGGTSGIMRDLSVLAGGGVAAGDYDRDGWPDLYITRGTGGANLLFRNRGDGTFAESGQGAGVALQGRFNAGATFADIDGDADLDLFVTGFNDTPPTLFRNAGDGTFTDVTAGSGLAALRQSFSAAFGDIDNDGDADLWVTHYLFNTSAGYLWRNDGSGAFTDISQAAGIQNGLLKDWTANFADINDDGWQDILVSGDFGTSQIYRNNGNGTFTRDTASRLSDENGMGAAVGDYDNDGDLDWFVSSITDPDGNRHQPGAVPWGASGNRFYENRNGVFADVTDATGTRSGNWGWGSCFADFNNDGALDLFHTNGFKASAEMFPLVYSFTLDQSKLFVAQELRGFSEQAATRRVDDDRQGRGIVCFDYDRDGDTDLFVANNEQAPLLYRNDGGNLNNWLQVQLGGEGGNTEAAGARIWVTSGTTTQMRELHIGSNYLSQNPLVAGFGLGGSTKADTLTVRWPSGKEAVLHAVRANQRVYVLPP